MSGPEPSSPEHVLIVGGGPAGLAIALAMDCVGLGDRIEVVDPSGTWMASWHRRFASQDIPHLRSPSVHHPHPDPFAMLAGAPREAFVSSGQTRHPRTDAFRDFLVRCIDDADLAGRVHPRSLQQLTIDPAGRPTAVLDDGTERRPDRVVLATNHRVPSIPEPVGPWVDDPRIVVGDALDVASTPAGDHVVVIGGGLSAAHLALGACARGASVTLVSRRRLRVRRYDTHPSWLGPNKRRPFEREPDPWMRRRAIDRARGGGSIPHAFHRRLVQEVEAGSLTLLERRSPAAIAEHGGALELRLDDGTRCSTDEIWLATGGRIDATRDETCRMLVERCPTTIADGLPELTPGLRWPGTAVHLVGGAAALQLGPMAGNLIGHRRAAQRLVAEWRGRDPHRADRTTTGAGACPTRHRPPQVSRRRVDT